MAYPRCWSSRCATRSRTRPAFRRPHRCRGGTGSRPTPSRRRRRSWRSATPRCVGPRTGGPPRATPSARRRVARLGDMDSRSLQRLREAAAGRRNPEAGSGRRGRAPHALDRRGVGVEHILADGSIASHAAVMDDLLAKHNLSDAQTEPLPPACGTSASRKPWPAKRAKSDSPAAKAVPSASPGGPSIHQVPSQVALRHEALHHRLAKKNDLASFLDAICGVGTRPHAALGPDPRTAAVRAKLAEGGVLVPRLRPPRKRN